MRLKIKPLNWSAGSLVVMLDKTAAKNLGAHIKDRVYIKPIGGNNHTRPLSAIIDLVEGLVKTDEIAISSEVMKITGLKPNQEVEVSLSETPDSIISIKKKLNKKTLSKKEITNIINDIVNNSLSEPEIALFVSAMYEQGMNMKEVVYLVEAIIDSGDRLKLKERLVVDKHSIGGIPGNRTSPIVVSICASAGLIMPKASSRAITSSAGTSDVIETIAPVEFSLKEVKKILKKTKGCLIWGGGILNVVPADSKITSIEKILNIDPEAQLLASIMAKKIAMGANYIVIDIPYGKTAKVKKQHAEELKKKFEFLGKTFHKKIKVILDEVKGPMGEGVGPFLELLDVIKVLDPKQESPKQLEDKSLILAGELFEMTGKAKRLEGANLARKILYSGKAFEKFKQIIKAQGGSLEKIKKLRLGRFHKDFFSEKSGEIKEIDNIATNYLARIAGCPADKFSGLKIHVSVKNKVTKGQKILTIYSESKQRLNEAIEFYNQNPLIIWE